MKCQMLFSGQIRKYNPFAESANSVVNFDILQVQYA